jgi:bifunctional non-homologous end joining protein LigD
VHVENGAATLYSKSGADYSRRFRAIRPVIANIPVKSAIIDCELVACDASGSPSFRTLTELGNEAPSLCLWCFDLLSIDGARVMPLPLTQRKVVLANLIAAGDDEDLQFSGDFNDPNKLLETCHKMNLEGIVSKRRESAYRSGPTKDCQKIKTSARRAVNRDRWELFQKKR